MKTLAAIVFVSDIKQSFLMAKSSSTPWSHGSGDCNTQFSPTRRGKSLKCNTVQMLHPPLRRGNGGGGFGRGFN